MDVTATDREFPPHPFLSIWTKPRDTIQQIAESDPRHLVLVLAALGGIAQSLDSASENNLGDSLGLWAILLLAIALGVVVGILGLYIGGAVTRWTGGWLGGQASSEHIRAAFAWGSVPFLWVSLLWIPELLLFGQEMFTTDTPGMEADSTLASVLLALVIVEMTGQSGRS